MERVFDGYRDDPAPKESAQMRRRECIVGTAVHFTRGMKLQTKKEQFLSNKENKQKFIDLLGDQLHSIGCRVIFATGDAGLDIVKSATSSSNRCDTVLVGDDTDLLVLLCNHAHDTAHHVFFSPESRSNVKKRPKSWNITTTRATLGSLVCCNILFTHAILGCDTTSHIFGLGKRIALTRLKRSRSFVEQSNTFSSSSASQEISFER